MKKILVLKIMVILALLSTSLIAQDTPPSRIIKPDAKQKSPFMERISLGGYLSVQFGSIVYVEVTPVVTYRVTNPFYVGVGFTYMYYKDKRYVPEYSSNGIGGRLFARYHVWRDLFAQVEYDPLKLSYFSDYDEFGNYVGWHKEKVWVHDLLLGGGYRQWIGGKAFATFMVFFNVNETVYSPYRNPIIRIGFGVGL